MITLALIRRMEEDGVAGLRIDKDLFWEELPLQRNGKPAQGVWAVTRQGDISQARRGKNLRTTIDIYVGFNDKIKTELTHERILAWLFNNPAICELEDFIPGTRYEYSFENVRIQPTTTPENYGATENGVIVKVASALLIYDMPNLMKGDDNGN